MCDHCAEAEEAGVLDDYLSGKVKCPACERESELKEWVEDRQLNGDDGSGFNDYKAEGESERAFPNNER